MSADPGSVDQAAAAAGDPTRAGTIAIVGKPNVGKSTLLNRMVGAKVSITSSRPQTTRHRLRGILTQGSTQFVFVDTPGFQERHGGALNRALNRAVQRAFDEVDLVLLVVAAGQFNEDDERVLRELPAGLARVVVVNKSDRLKSAEGMLPFLQGMGARVPGAEIVPVSANSGRNVPRLLEVIAPMLPAQPFLYDADDITDRDERFLAAEAIREKLFRSMGDEVPYGSVVTIESFQLEGTLRRIHANVHVEKESHKAMIVGADGERMKSIASAARHDLERLFGGKVHLEVWVKTRRGWSASAADLKRFGFEA